MTQHVWEQLGAGALGKSDIRTTAAPGQVPAWPSLGICAGPATLVRVLEREGMWRAREARSLWARQPLVRLIQLAVPREGAQAISAAENVTISGPMSTGFMLPWSSHSLLPWGELAKPRAPSLHAWLKDTDLVSDTLFIFWRVEDGEGGLESGPFSVLSSHWVVPR